MSLNLITNQLKQWVRSVNVIQETYLPVSRGPNYDLLQLAETVTKNLSYNGISTVGNMICMYTVKHNYRTLLDFIVLYSLWINRHKLILKNLAEMFVDKTRRTFAIFAVISNNNILDYCLSLCLKCPHEVVCANVNVNVNEIFI